eukprot:2425799-Pyramimonas_sp.AAC.1
MFWPPPPRKKAGKACGPAPGADAEEAIHAAIADAAAEGEDPEAPEDHPGADVHGEGGGDDIDKVMVDLLGEFIGPLEEPPEPDPPGPAGPHGGDPGP